MEIVDDTGSDVYLEILHHLLTSNDARKVAPRSQATFEALNVTLRITDPGEVHVLRTARKPNLRIAATEAMHLVGGLSSLTQLDLASGGRFSQFANDDRLLGAYGPRAFHQLIAVDRLLRRDPDTRQAVVSLWTGQEHDATSRDVPCTTTLQFFIRGDALYLRVTMRSNDAWLGLPYDLMMFSCLQRTLACALGVEPGEYTHSVGSMHLYERDLDAAYRVIDAGANHAIPNHVSVGIPVPLLHIERRSYQDLAANAGAVCFHDRPDWELLPAYEWLYDRVPQLPEGETLCLSCRYVTAGDECDACGASPHASETLETP
jgi:thymidylate synthase